ncbi:MAG: putative Ig domain-containing protein [Caulobacteraceae bacterium]|nr:putative Ig domain-containing protein [Caulobacteraceae bacterium]
MTITGASFTGATAVDFGGTPATGFTVNSDTQITATAPAGAAGTVDVTVTTASGTSPTGASDHYTYVAAPTVTGVSPNSGGAAGGTSVTITGTDFTGATAVKFGATNATGFTVNSATQITATAPAGSAGTVDVTVVTTGGTSATGASDHFTYTAIALSPGSLPAGAVATAYSQTITSSGGTGPYTYAVTAGALPAGLALASGGALTGTPTAGGTFNFTVTATDSLSATGSQAYSLTIAAPTITISPTTLPAGTIAAAYSQSVTASGGTSTYTYAVTAGALPAGMSLSSAGALSGTPTAAGGFNFTITATDSSTGTGPYTGSRAYSLTVGAPTITLSPTTLPHAAVGASYSQSVTASGGTSTYSYAVTAGALPAGVSLSSGGALTGAPTAGGTFNFTITATDSSTGTGPFTGSQAYSLTVDAPTISVTPASLPAGQVATAYSQTVSASGGTSTYSFAVTAGALPAGLTLAAGGALSGTPTAGGTFNFTITATDSSTGTGPYTGSRAYSLTIGAPTITISPASLPAATVASAYSQSLSAAGGSGPYSYAITAGALPAGLTLSAGGVLSGTSTAAGSFNFTVTATDSSTGAGPYTGSRAYSLSVGAPTIAIAPASLPAAAVGSSYSQTVSASGGTSPYSYAVTAGALPAGLSLASGGALSGTPTAAGSFNFTVTATDSSTGTGAPFTAARAYSLTVNAPTITVSPASLPAAAVGSSYSQTVSASGGTSPYSYAVTAGSLPAGLSLTSGGALSGTPTAGGSFNFTVTATDSSTGTGAPFTSARAYSLTVNAPTIAVSPATLSNPTVGTSVSTSLSASGGTGPYSFAVTAGALPTGLSLSSAGALTGTPTAAGAFNFTVSATDSSSGTGPYVGARAYSVTVGAPTLALSPASLPSGVLAIAYSQAVSASGGTGPYSYAVTGGALPTGITLSAGGLLSGTPTAGGSFSVTITATDSSTGTGAPFHVSKTYGLTIAPPNIVLAPVNLPAANFGAAYHQTLTASGGIPTYSYAVTAGALPPGISLSAAGVLSGAGTAAGVYAFTVTATDSSTGAGPYTGSRAYSVTINAPAIVIEPSSLPSGTTGVVYTQTLSASGGQNPYSYAVTAGALPSGLTLSSRGALTGVPTAGGAFSFTVTVTDSSVGTGAPFHQTKTYNLTIGAATITVGPASLPNATVASAYSQTISASGGVPAYSYAVTAGALPPGMTLASNGQLSGAPTQSGTFNFTVAATDSSTGSGPYVGAKAFSLTVVAPTIVLSPASLAGAVSGQAYSQTISASGGVGPYSYAVTGGALPTGLSLSGAGVISGTPTAGGVFSVTVTATDSATGPGAPFHQSKTYSLTVAAPAITLGPANLPAASLGEAYGTAITATGGVSPYSYAVTGGALPAGLTLTSAGTFSGAPTASGNFNFTVTASDSSTGAGPYANSRAFSLAVSAPVIVLAPGSLPAGAVGAHYSQAITASGGTSPYSFAVTAGALPAGLTLTSQGVLSGTPSAGGTFSVSITATDSSAGAGAPFHQTKTYTLTIAAPTFVFAPASLPAATVASNYHQAITATGGTGPYAYAISSGALPAGVSLGADGTLSGAPTAGGSFNFTVRVTDSSTGTGPYSGTQAFTLLVNGASLSITPATLPNGQQAQAYSQSLSASGGVAPYSFAVTAGALPPGLTLTRVGVISGTPSGSGTFGFNVTASDSSGGAGPYQATKTYSILINAPAAPTAGAATITVVFNTAKVADLSPVIGGVATGVSIATPPTHGGVTAAGKVVTYTPDTGYFGVDGFDYQAVGPGGSSAPAHVTVNVSRPTPPTAGPLSVTVPYGGPGQSIDLTSAITGPVTSVAVTVAPHHGTAVVSGETVVYTPASTYAGADSFTYQATGPGGVSNSAVVSINVVAAAPVAVSETASTPANQAVTIQAGANDTGPITSLVITTAPTHGSAQAAGLAITYTPATDYAGPDSFAYKAVGPGGESAPVTDAITVTALPPPVAPPIVVNDANTVTSGGSVTIHIVPGGASGMSARVSAASGGSGGSDYTVNIVTQPAHGVAVVSGHDIIYTANAGYSGPDPFTYSITTAFGTSAPATITVTVTLAPSAQNFTATTPALTPVTVDVTVGATGASATGVQILSISPSNSGTATADATSTPGHFAITFTPSTQFAGRTVVSFALLSAQGASPPATLTITVQPRPDPSLDPDVRGLIGAQGEATRRFAEAQISNFSRRMEQLHGMAGEGAGGGAASLTGRSSLGLNFDFGDYGQGALRDERPETMTRLWQRADLPYLTPPSNTDVGLKRLAAGPSSSQGRQVLPDGVSIWVAGTIDLGQRHATTGQAGVKFDSSGVSLGLDRAFGKRLMLGIGAGWGHTEDDVGSDGTRTEADNWVATLYGSYNPVSNLYVDGLFGYGGLNFKSRRHTVGDMVTGSRDGDELFGSLSAAWEHRDRRLHLSPYGRIDIAEATLNPFTEVGDPIWALAYGHETVRLLTGSLGIHGDYVFTRRWGDFSPRFRAEYRHDFNGAESVAVRYADLLDGQIYTVSPNLMTRDNLLLGLGGEWRLNLGWRFSFDWEATSVTGQQNGDRYILKASHSF